MDERLQTIVFKNLLGPGQNWDRFDWQPFREGVRIHRIYGDGESGPSAAFLRYDPAAGIPLHRHLGYEHIFLLSENQSDDRGTNSAGTLIINPPGSSHSVRNERGGVVLVIWEKPVVFESSGATSPTE